MKPSTYTETIFAVWGSTTGVRDPVCHMTVSPGSPHRLEHQGQQYQFCTARCLKTFRAWPQGYRGTSEHKG